MIFSVDKVRADFPVLSREVNGLPLAYLDKYAASSTTRKMLTGPGIPPKVAMLT